MIKPSAKNKKANTLVIGLGETGYSIVHFLRNKNIDVVVTDTRFDPPCLEALHRDFPEVPVILGEISKKTIAEYNAIYLSPGISAPTNDDFRGDIDIFMNEAKAPVIAITGTNGKTTVTHLVSKMLIAGNKSILMGGNVGVPALRLLQHPVPDFYVLELSSFQLQNTYNLNFHIACCVNISEDHLDRHGDLESYVKIKMRVYQDSKKAILNRTCKYTNSNATATFALDAPPNNSSFGIKKHSGEEFLFHGNTPLFSSRQLNVLGRHNQENVLAALAIVQATGTTLSQHVLQVAQTFVGLEHRCELVKSENNVTWVNDSKATNPGACLAALSGFSAPIVWIAGGQSKNSDLTLLCQQARHTVRHAVFYGEDSDKLMKASEGYIPYTVAKDFNDVIAQTIMIISPGDTVLFSPACASFDMFKNYEHRGAEFKKLVLKLTKNK